MKTTHELEEDEFARFGPIHLSVISLHKTIDFWIKIVGLKLISSTDQIAWLGSDDTVLVVIHAQAKKQVRKGFSGLYHVALHAPDEFAFAQMMYRLMVNNYPCAPTDHTMSKAVYFEDPDGITIELTLETPQRLRRIISSRGMMVEDIDGKIRPISAPLDVNAVMKYLPSGALPSYCAPGTKIGHVHFYAHDVEASFRFYKTLGFTPFNDVPEFTYADLGAGGSFKHRIALNSWHGRHQPLAPSEQAGMLQLQISFRSQDMLNMAIENIPDHQKVDGGFIVNDPTGNLLFLTEQEKFTTSTNSQLHVPAGGR